MSVISVPQQSLDQFTSTRTLGGTQVVEEGIFQSGTTSILVKRITQLECTILEQEQRHCQQSIRLNQVAFKAAKAAGNLQKQIELNEAMIAQKNAHIAELSEDLQSAHNTIDQVWHQIDDLTDTTELNKITIRDLKIKLRSHKRRIGTINQRLGAARIALADQKKLIKMIIERQKMKGMVERNIGLSSGSGLATAIFGSLLISPYFAIPAASLCTGLLLSDNPSTQAEKKYRELSIEIETVAVRMENANDEDERIENTQPPLLDPILQRERRAFQNNQVERMKATFQTAALNALTTPKKTRKELIALGEAALARVINSKQELSRQTATAEEISDVESEQQTAETRKETIEDPIDRAPELRTNLSEIMAKLTAEQRARQQTPEFKARIAEITKKSASFH